MSRREEAEARLAEAEAAFDVAEADLAATLRALRRRAEVFTLPPTTRSVLVVDDDPLIRKLFARVLRRLPDVEAVLVSSIAEAEVALGLGDEAPSLPLPRVVLIDQQLPDGDGWTLAARVPRRKDVRVILMSGAIEPRLLEKLGKTVTARWIEKPITMGPLLRIVEEELAAAEG